MSSTFNTFPGVKRAVARVQLIDIALTHQRSYISHYVLAG